MQAFACVAGQCIAAASVHYAFIALGAITPMAPPRDTAGTQQQPQQHERQGRYNQKSTFRNGTTEEGWFYPTPAAVKAAADVRGARAARESCCLRSIRRPRAQATRKPITRTSSSTATTRTAWCTASEARLPALSPLGLTCVCDPHRPREDSSGNYGGLRRVRPRTQASAVRH